MTATTHSRARQPLRDAASAMAMPAGGLVRAVLAVVALSIAVVVYGSGFHQYDLQVFYRAGEHLLQGRSLYPSLDDPAFHAGHAFVYPPPAAVLFAPLAMLPVAVAHVAFNIATACALAAALWLLGARSPLLFLPVLLSQSSLRGVQVGSLNAFLLLGLAVSWRWRDRARTSSAVVAALVVAKLLLSPLVAWLAVTRWRLALAAVAVSATLLATSIALGFDVPAYLHMLDQLSRREVAHSIGPVRQLTEWGASFASAQLLALALALLLVGAAAWEVRRGAHERLLFGTCIVAALVASPIVWTHYLILLFAAVLTLPRARVAWVAALAAIGWLWGASHTALPDSTTLMAQAMMACTLAALWSQRGRGRRGTAAALPLGSSAPR